MAGSALALRGPAATLRGGTAVCPAEAAAAGVEIAPRTALETPPGSPRADRLAPGWPVDRGAELESREAQQRCTATTASRRTQAQSSRRRCVPRVMSRIV